MKIASPQTNFLHNRRGVRGRCARALPLTRLRTFSKVLRNPKIFGKRVKAPVSCIGNRLNALKTSRLSWGEFPLK